MPKAIIIGAGVAGIATAIRLKIKGYEVEVFEANAYPGGKLSEFKQDGFRFDAGPSLLTMPQYIDQLFLLAGKNPKDYLEYRQLPVICKYFYPDGTKMTAWADKDKFVDELSKATSEPKENLVRGIENSTKIYQATHEVFLESSLHQFKTFFSRKGFKALFRLSQIDSKRTMHSANEGFFRSKKLVQFFDRYATYNGSDPYRAPATLNVIPHLEQHYGAWFPNGGMYAIVKSMVKLAEELGVSFNYNAPVNEIMLEYKKAVGIKVADAIHKADIVISNSDVWFTYKRLLANFPELHPQKLLSQARSSSALIFYWGIKKEFEFLDLHNIFFSKDYKAEFDAIWQQQTIAADPTVYLNISSKLASTDAPEGCENWFVMINVPANNGQDWDKLIKTAKQNILSKLSDLLKEDVGKLIVSETVLDPRSIESKTSSFQGSIYGTSSNDRFAAFLRHANQSANIKNLFFCGGSVHPGGGIPLCLLSAKIVSELAPRVST